MAQDRFLIAPFKSGLQTGAAPFLIPEDAFEELRNAYVFRGRVRKRFGSNYTGSGAATALEEPLYSRLRIALTGGAGVGVTDGTGAANGTVPGAIFKIGQAFSVDDEIFTIYQTGTPAATLSTGAGTLTYNTTTGAYVITGAAATTQVYFYPAEPVMGLGMYESGTINDHVAYAMDTQFIYKFSGGIWALDGPPATYFNGDNSDFFWITNADGTTSDDTNMFISNFQAAIGVPAAGDDNIWTYDGTTWSAFNPNFTVAGDNVLTAKIILPFKDRLILLNTIEQDAAAAANTAYPNRCRFSHNGSPLSASAFYEPDEVGATGGGFIEAPTEEEIVSAVYIKDRLMVYFERSTWELAYTNNHIQPFQWQRINSELGSESTFSAVPFDKVALSIGSQGITACDGINIKRIDESIPDEVYKIINTFDGIKRIHGVRDYFTEMVYWTFPPGKGSDDNTYPSRVLVYSYSNNTWAYNDDCITTFGYFEQQSDRTWATTHDSWVNANYTWISGLNQANFRQIIAGNHQGYVFSLNPAVGSNAGVMQITNLTYTAATNLVTAVMEDHTLSTGDYIKLSNVQGVVLSGDGIYKVTRVDANTVTFVSSVFTGAYTGGGVAARVSNYSIKSKMWNPYLGTGDNLYLSEINFLVSRTDDGEVTVNYRTSSTDLNMIDESNSAIGTGALLGTSILETSPYATINLEQIQDYLWHPVYFQAEGNFVQIYMYLTDDQIIVPEIADSLLEIQAMVLKTERVRSWQ